MNVFTNNTVSHASGRALISGCLWAGVGYAIAYASSPISSQPLQVGQMFWRGLVAAPFIGLLIGRLSRSFAELTALERSAVALADIYLAAWLFLLATGTGFASRSYALQALVVRPVVGSLVGLTFTGLVLALWPLSYATHLACSKAWQAERSPSSSRTR